MYSAVYFLDRSYCNKSAEVRLCPGQCARAFTCKPLQFTQSLAVDGRFAQVCWPCLSCLKEASFEGGGAHAVHGSKLGLNVLDQQIHLLGPYKDWVVVSCWRPETGAAVVLADGDPHNYHNDSIPGG